MDLKKTELTKKVGNNIRKHRLYKDLTIQKLALQSGIEYSHLSKIERGVVNTSVYQVYLISRTLGIPMESIFIDL